MMRLSNICRYSSSSSDRSLIIPHFERLEASAINYQFLYDPAFKGWTLLHFLCFNNKKSELKVDLAKILIENGANVNAKTEGEKETPLHVLCRYQDDDNLIDMIQLLIEKGADVNAKMSNGMTPLRTLFMYYKKDDLFQIVQLLMKKGAVDFNPKNGKTDNRIFKAILKSSLQQILMFLLMFDVFQYFDLFQYVYNLDVPDTFSTIIIFLKFICCSLICIKLDSF